MPRCQHACVSILAVGFVFNSVLYAAVFCIQKCVRCTQNPAQTGEPPFPKPVYGELGCCTPYIIVPGAWSDTDMEYQAEMILTGAAGCVWMGGSVCCGSAT